MILTLFLVLLFLADVMPNSVKGNVIARQMLCLAFFDLADVIAKR